MADTCQARTKVHPPFYRGSPCGRVATRDGFCKTHHPDAVEARKAARAAKGEAKLERWRKEHDFRTRRPAEYRDALKRIADGAENYREIARFVLLKWDEE